MRQFYEVWEPYFKPLTVDSDFAEKNICAKQLKQRISCHDIMRIVLIGSI